MITGMVTMAAAAAAKKTTVMTDEADESEVSLDTAQREELSKNKYA